MNSYRDMMRFTAGPLLISLLTISTVLGCGQLPQGRERIMTFRVTGFTVAVPMAYSDAVAVRAQVPGISQSQQAASAFVTRVIMESVNEVLQQEGRNAGLLPAVISLILQQITVQINYIPLRCDAAFVNPPGMITIVMNVENCIIVGNTLNAVCRSNQNNQMCMLGAAMNLFAIDEQHLRITGTLRIANPIMAGWSREMWQSVLSRVARNLASGPFGENFRSASVTVG